MDIETADIILSRQQTIKVLIRLCGCAGWSAPLLFAYGINRFSWRGSYHKNTISNFQYAFHLNYIFSYKKPQSYDSSFHCLNLVWFSRPFSRLNIVIQPALNHMQTKRHRTACVFAQSDQIGHLTNELHEVPFRTIWAMTRQNQQCECTPSEDSDQPGHLPRSESSLSAWRKLGSLATHYAHIKDSDQTGRMPRPILSLRWVHSHIVGFVMLQLICVNLITHIPGIWQVDFL